MKNKHIDTDMLLKNALSTAETPGLELIRKVKNINFKEETHMKKNTVKRSFSTVAAVAATLAVLTVSAFAAWHFLSPGEIADELGDSALSAAFESKDAVNINKTVEAGGYMFTLLAVVSGEDITDMPYYSERVQADRTYAVVAIKNSDGSPMPDTSADEYGQISFITSPLVKGLQPWLVNAWTMNGGHSDTVEDGVLYRLVECDGVTMFADRGLYFAVATGDFINNTTFLFDAVSGEISANPDYDGASVVFDLPIDKSLADPQRAQEYLDAMWD